MNPKPAIVAFAVLVGLVLPAAAMASVVPFKDGERVAFLGDSIRPDRVVVMFGMNDVVEGGAAAYREWMPRLCDALDEKIFRKETLK